MKNTYTQKQQKIKQKKQVHKKHTSNFIYKDLINRKADYEKGSTENSKHAGKRKWKKIKRKTSREIHGSVAPSTSCIKQGATE